MPGFDGAALARAGVVVVTANHRVGVDGYAELGGAPPNRALLDQMAALRWVQEEIRAFGGDPARVTVFGESAGAGAIAALMVMPLAKDLFSQAIVHSVPGTYFSPDMARGISAELLEPIGLKPTVAALADVPPERLLEAMAQLPRRMPSVNRWGPFSPVVDGEMLPTDPWTGLAAGAGHDVPLMVGHNRDEWRLFLVLDGLVGAVTDDMAREAMELFGPGHDRRSPHANGLPGRHRRRAVRPRAFRPDVPHAEPAPRRRTHRRRRPRPSLRADLARARRRRSIRRLPWP